MKEFSEEQVDNIIRLKWGKLVTEASGPTYTSNRALRSLFKVTRSQIRNIAQKSLKRRGCYIEVEMSSILYSCGKQVPLEFEDFQKMFVLF